MSSLSDASDWSRWLGQAMRRKGLGSNRDLSRVSGVSDSVISRWRTEGARPTIPQLRLLVEPLQVRLLDLLVVSGHLTEQERQGADPSASRRVSDVEQAVAGSDLDDDLKRSVLVHWRSAQTISAARARQRDRRAAP